MPNYNKVFLMGNLTRDPELRFTTSGAPVTNLRMAINRVYTDAAGERKEEVCFLTVVVWGKQAESCAEYLAKGRPVFVEGRLRTRTIQSQNEEEKNKTMLEIIADRVQFLGSKPKNESAGATERESEMRKEGEDLSEEENAEGKEETA
ncbi:MAG: single-stranded DNA-binding protein [Candidatus Ratteibacteria bacterium]|nr:single-stranded DNA-binding protein [Candidatus Ratteibacteria bacterium]